MRTNRDVWSVQHPRRAHGLSGLFMVLGWIGLIPGAWLTWSNAGALASWLMGAWLTAGVGLLLGSWRYVNGGHVPGGLGRFWASQALFYAMMTTVCLGVIRVNAWGSSPSIVALILGSGLAALSGVAIWGFWMDTRPRYR